MTTPSSYQKEMNGVILVFILCFLVFWGALFYNHKTTQRKTIESLLSIHSREITSFKIHPDKTYTEDYQDAIEFAQEDKFVRAFFQAISDSQPYNPQHDQALAHWGIQIQIETTTLRIGCYIPDHKSGTVAGTIYSESSSGDFQSRLLLRWYQKYGHYWKIGNYQKVQYSRVKPILTSMSSDNITAFTVIPGTMEASQGEDVHDFSQDTQLVTEFFESLEDMRFAAPRQNELHDQWTIHVDTGPTSLFIECSLSTENPSVVVGLIDSHAGLTYFQSQHLYHWYQKYSHRWLTPDEAKETSP